jgi:hypothetical protein
MQTLQSRRCERTNDDDPGGKGCCAVNPMASERGLGEQPKKQVEADWLQ